MLFLLVAGWQSESLPSRARGDHSQNHRPCAVHRGAAPAPLTEHLPSPFNTDPSAKANCWSNTRSLEIHGSLNEKWQFLFCLEWSSTCSWKLLILKCVKIAAFSRQLSDDKWQGTAVLLCYLA